MGPDSIVIKMSNWKAVDAEVLKRLLRNPKFANSSGLTLVELLIVIVILGSLSMGISALIQDASRGLERSSNDNIATRQALRLINTLRYDVNSSRDIYIYSFQVEGDCSPTPEADVETSKPWLKISIRDLMGETGDYTESPQTLNVIYSFDKGKFFNDIEDNWYLSRSVCTGSGDSKRYGVGAERILRLGKEIDLNAVNSQTLVNCVPSCQLKKTTFRVKQYSFTLPLITSTDGLSSDVSLRNRILLNLVTRDLTNLTRRVTAE